MMMRTQQAAETYEDLTVFVGLANATNETSDVLNTTGARKDHVNIYDKYQ